MIDFVNESGLGSIGTADMAGEQIERLTKQSGGFGCYMQLAHEWANPVATHRSYELIAQRVMPEFQGQAYSTLNAKARAVDDAARIGGSKHEGRRGDGRQAPGRARRQLTTGRGSQQP